MRLERKTSRLWPMLMSGGLLVLGAGAQAQQTVDPRVGLKPGWKDAGVAARGMELVSNVQRPEGFFNPANPGDFSMMNSDLAFRGTFVFQGSFNGFQIYDVSNPAQPRLRVVVSRSSHSGAPPRSAASSRSARLLAFA